jgi:hypothetical protein
MDRKLQVDTLILIPMFKIYVFGIPDRQTDKRTDRWTENTPAARGLEELFQLS